MGQLQIGWCFCHVKEDEGVYERMLSNNVHYTRVYIAKISRRLSSCSAERHILGLQFIHQHLIFIPKSHLISLLEVKCRQIKMCCPISFLWMSNGDSSDSEQKNNQVLTCFSELHAGPWSPQQPCLPSCSFWCCCQNNQCTQSLRGIKYHLCQIRHSCRWKSPRR